MSLSSYELQTRSISGEISLYYSNSLEKHIKTILDQSKRENIWKLSFNLKSTDGMDLQYRVVKDDKQGDWMVTDWIKYCYDIADWYKNDETGPKPEVMNIGLLSKLLDDLEKK